MHHRRRIWDPLYGRLELSPLEWKFVFTPDIQRLRHVRMCNIDSLLIPGAAEPTRFEHMLGVLRLVNEWLMHNHVSGDQADDLRIAAIAHDMQTGPFGHSIQYVYEENKVGGGNFVHEDLLGAEKNLFHQAVRANASYLGMPFELHKLCGERWSNVSNLIAGKGELGPLIAGVVDLDNIDNVVRMAFHMGLCLNEDKLLPMRLARAMMPLSGSISLPESSIRDLERWQLLRRKVYEFLLLDWGEFSGKAMLTRAFEEAVKHECVGVDSWRMTDEELIHHFLLNVGDSQVVKELSRRLRLGQLYSPLFLGRSSSSENYKKLNAIAAKREIELEIKREADQLLGRTVYNNTKSREASLPFLILHFILDRKKTKRSVPVVIQEGGSKRVVGEDTDQLLIGLFVSRQVPIREQNAIKTAAFKLLGQHGIHDIIPLIDPLSDEFNSNALL